MLSDELRGIDWDRTPIRNFLDARPTPKSVAGALIKLGLLSPLNADDYDWEEIDYTSYPSVRRLLLDYANREPHSKLEELLIRAGKMLEKREGEEVPQGNPLEAYEMALREMEPRQALNEVAVVATSPEFLAEVMPKLGEYFKEGLKPPKNLFETALKRAFILATEVADRLIPPDEEGLMKYFAMRLKGNVTTNPAYRKFFSAKELSAMATEALREAELVGRKRTTETGKAERKETNIQNLITLLNEVIDTGNVLKLVIPLELSEEQKRAINTSSMRPSKLLSSPPLFAYAVFYNKKLAEEAIHENPRKAQSLLEKLYRLAWELSELNLKSRTVVSRYREKALPLGKNDVRRRLAKTIALTLSHQLNPPAIELEGKTPAMKLAGEELNEEMKKWARETLSLLNLFLPNLAREVKAEMLKSGHRERPPAGLIVPTLMNPLDEMLAEEIENLSKSERNFPREDWVRLNSYGLRVGDGYVRLYKGRLLHAITAVQTENGRVELRPYALLYWFDPVTGMILKQTGENSFRVVGVDDIMRELSRKAGQPSIFGPAYSGKEALELIFSSGKETMPMRPTGPLGSSRALGVAGSRTGSEATSNDVKTLEEFMKHNEWVRETVEKVLRENPNPDNFIHWVAKAVREFGPKETLEAMKFTLRFPIVDDPRLGSLIYRATLNHHYHGRYFF